MSICSGSEGSWTVSGTEPGVALGLRLEMTDSSRECGGLRPGRVLLEKCPQRCGGVGIVGKKAQVV